ncbi:MAG: U32 family peptidase [Bacilli bacterium]|nr:U32 family peptidase [Bacilli bacterium]
MKKCFKSEILAPCGDMDAFYAAIEAGSDAVYLAGKMFGARAFSKNFTNDELIYIINYAHKYGVKVYVTCNILIYESEVEKFLEFVEFLHKNQVDAIIMQDIGMIDLVHKIYPNLEIHGSTQMHIHNLDGALMAEKLGLKRIVLARETPLEVIRDIKKKTNLEIEVFVQGALCASFSGMCLFASSIGPRSGNRGTCSGCCRLPYDVLDKDGNIINDGKYPLSMKDLMTINDLDKLIDANIDSFKIEGRMKSKEYVYTTVSMYKYTRDNYLKTGKVIVNKEDLYKLNNIFTRTYTRGFILNDVNVTNDKSPNHIGVLIGRVIKSNKNYIEIKLDEKVLIHDGLRIINNNFEYGFNLNEFKINNKQVYLANKEDIISLKVKKQIPINSLVYRTFSKEIEDEISDKINKHVRRVPISFSIKIRKDIPVSLVINDGNYEIELLGSIPNVSINKSITIDDIKKKLAKINNTIYSVTDINIELDNDLFVPISEVNHLKQNILEELDKKRINLYNKELIKEKYTCLLDDYPKVNEYSILTNNKNNITDKYSIIYSEMLDNTIRKIPKVIENYSLYNKNKEYLVGELGSLNKLNNVICDYSFNVTNSYTVAFLHSLGVKRVTLSVELIDKEIENLINNYHDRYHKHPNLEVIKKTTKELMVLKLNLNKYGDVYHLRDRFKNNYKIIKKDKYFYIYDYKETIREREDNYYFNMGINYLRDEIL